MAIEVKAGAFVKSTTTTGFPFDITTTGIGFLPKAAIFLYGGSNSNPTDIMRPSIGMATATEQVGAGYTTSDNVGTTICDRLMSNTAAVSTIAGAAKAVEMALKEFNSDGWIFTYTVNNNGAHDISYLAIGGADITNVKIVTFNANTSTGDQDITTIGFQPDALIFLYTHSVLNTITAHACIGMGVATGASNQGAWCVASKDAQDVSVAKRYQQSDSCIVLLDPAAPGTVIGEASFVSFLSNGFRINWSVAPATGNPIAVLAIKGGSWQAGVDTAKITTTGTKATSLPWTPKAILLSGFCNIAAAAVQAHARMHVGVATGTTAERALWAGEEDAAGTAITARAYSTTRSIQLRDEAVAGTTSAIVADAELSAFNTSDFTLNWLTVDANAYQFTYLAAGDSALLVRVVNETTNIAEGVQKVIGPVKLVNETIQVAETTNKILGFVKNVNETMQVAEALNRLGGLSRVINETVNINEALNRLSALVRTINESVEVAEAANRIEALVRVVNESVQVAEALNKIIGLIKVINENVQVAEALNRILGLIKVINESVSINEAENHTRALVRLVNESVQVEEAINRLSNLVRTVNESQQIAEALNHIKGLIRAINETQNINESVNRVVGIIRAINETIQIAETANKVLGLVRIVNESANINEAVNKVIGLVKTVTESQQITEATNRLSNLVRVVNEPVEIVETINRLGGLVRAINESVSISEAENHTRALVRLINENEEIIEAANRISGLIRTVNETQEIAELVNSALGIVRVINETQNVDEAINKVIGLIRVINENMAILEVLNQVRGLVRVINEDTNIEEAANKLVQFGLVAPGFAYAGRPRGRRAPTVIMREQERMKRPEREQELEKPRRKAAVIEEIKTRVRIQVSTISRPVRVRFLVSHVMEPARLSFAVQAIKRTDIKIGVTKLESPVPAGFTVSRLTSSFIRFPVRAKLIMSLGFASYQPDNE